MTITIRPGIEKPEGPPPDGEQAQCPRCSALVMTDSETEFLPVIYVDPSSDYVYPGWLVICSWCNYPRVPIKQKAKKKKIL